MSLHGKIELDNGSDKSLLAPEDFISGYRTTAIQPDQWISGIHIPALLPNQKHAIYKISKRAEDDITTVVLALNFTFDKEERVSDCVIAAGGIAAKSVRLPELEAIVTGQKWTREQVTRVQAEVDKVVKPLSDVRGSAGYRILLIKNLFQRFYLQCQQVPVRLTDHA